MSERARTILLLILLVAAVGFLIWTQSQYASNFEQTF